MVARTTLRARKTAALTMLRGPAGLLSRLAQRAPLARAALPLLAAFAPEAFHAGCARSLHVYARTSASRGEYGKVEVGDGATVAALKRAVIAKLKLDVPPDCVRLLREVAGGGAPVRLDSRRALAEQGVFEGTSVHTEVLAVAPPFLQAPARPAALQAPIFFFAEDVGGTPMMVADLAFPSAPAPLPFFLTLREHAALQRFLAARPSADRPLALSLPSMLMLTGAAKSGKSRILHYIIPGMLSAAHAAAAGSPRPCRRPEIFSYTFPLYRPAEECAGHLVGALLVFASERGLCVQGPWDSPLNQFPSLAAALAARVHERGGELWLLLDELGAPGMASEPRGAGVFTLQVKDMLHKVCAAGGLVVGTDSGMLSLLCAVRAAPPSGFALWDAVSHVRLGGTPTPAAALAMARRLHAHFSAAWPRALAGSASPERCVEELTGSAVTSPRPALAAYLLELLGTADEDAGVEKAWQRARYYMLRKLCQESAQDAAVALQRLPAQGLRLLRHLADGRPVGAARRPHAGSSALDVALLLCEDAEGGAALAAPALLKPPYGALIGSWVTREGQLAVASAGGSQGLPLLTRSNLKALHALAPRFPASLRSAVSEAVLRVMLDNGLGVAEGGGSGAPSRLRAPRTVEEFVALPAIGSVLGALAAEAAQAGQEAVEGLSGLLRTPRDSPARAEHMQVAGLRALVLLRHVEAHAAFPWPDSVIVHGGFSLQVIVSAVNAALAAVLAHEARAFELNRQGVLCCAGLEPAKEAAARAA